MVRIMNCGGRFCTSAVNKMNDYMELNISRMGEASCN